MIELLRTRRSIRKYTTQPVPPEAIATLVESTPALTIRRGINPWEFVIIDDPTMLVKLSRAKEMGSAF